MPADVRIQEVTTDVHATDAAALLTPPVLERIVQAVLQRLEEQKGRERELDEERSLGSDRGRRSGSGR
jgi:hypothetical protein